MADLSNRPKKDGTKQKKKKPERETRKLPGTYLRFIEKFPRLGELHEKVGKAVDKIGPLDPKTRELIKIGICTGSRQESALKSHVRRALCEGATLAEIEQTIMFAMNTCGFPTTVAAWRWASEQLEREKL
jgi:alkylhydroperoxidase/carboxymuconolactone decarboxylase family protein YurZ